MDSQRIKELNFFIRTMDTLHFNIFHLFDVGLRIDLSDVKNDDGDDNDAREDDSSLVDAAVLRIRDIVRAKRKQCAFDRMDGADAKSKFTVDGGVQQKILTQKGFDQCTHSQMQSQTL